MACFSATENSFRSQLLWPLRRNSRRLILGGICYIFLRITDKAVTTANISNEVVFQQLDATEDKLIKSLQNYFLRLAVPSLETFEDWGVLGRPPVCSPDIEEFFIGINQYLETIKNACENMSEQVCLADGEKMDSAIQFITSSEAPSPVISSEKVERLSRLVQQWIREIEKLLNQSEQVRQESDDIGPSVELTYWKARMVRFTNLFTELRTPYVQAVIATLQLAKARILKYWKELLLIDIYLCNQPHFH
ncbi:unnamed protein product [Dicrocoelium dendriticum]|nr:unnamed protein product [Dicrocoelium dendriticum]